MDSEFVRIVIEGYKDVVVLAVPVTFFIAACNIGINMIVSAFMGGRLHMGGK